ncbi:hypothetical protein PO124_29665 [Bacillus licheniformis]|nr:hypothetical protein [Bacillus licheniformis]
MGKSLKEAPPIHMATINRHMELLLAYETITLWNTVICGPNPKDAACPDLAWKAYELVDFLFMKRLPPGLDICLLVEKSNRAIINHPIQDAAV